MGRRRGGRADRRRLHRRGSGWWRSRWPDGSWAEQIAAVPAEAVAVLPDGVGFAEAATLPVAALTALRLVRESGTLLGRRVLVTGAAGGVGRILVQLAAWPPGPRSPRWPGTPSGPRASTRWARPRWSPRRPPPRARSTRSTSRPGAVADRRAEPGAPRRDGLQLRQLLRRGLTPGLLLPVLRRARSRPCCGTSSSSPAPWLAPDLAALARLVADGRLSVEISLKRDWEQVNEVLAAVRDRQVTGKAVLTIG